MNKITILGSGTSTGVPILGCNCKVCQSTEPRNKRFRTSGLIELESQNKILIDASPDLRSQLLREKVPYLDAVIITHDHADHTHGMDDLSLLVSDHNLLSRFLLEISALKALKINFPISLIKKLFFGLKPVLGGGIPQLELRPVSEGKNKILDQELEFFALPHGHEISLGIRHQKMAYLVDYRQIPPLVIERLTKAKLELLILDCLRPTLHQTHLHLDLALEYLSKISPKNAILTHLGHEWDYLELLGEIRRRGVKNTFPAHDGQSFYYS